ncbi:hypothetical protein ANN_06639 [Periplaneta americana]|uniref:Uncharacterized protein n=1 Tax=Periplaneta americana TaxID=6978 RepID=A0ABQ8TGH3_PERAM|nr:hypothetical protein ANN_06639 [Periplaneta americana]
MERNRSTGKDVLTPTRRNDYFMLRAQDELQLSEENLLLKIPNVDAIASYNFVSEFGPNQVNSSVGLNDVSPEPKSPEQSTNSSQLSRLTATPEASTSHKDIRSLLPSPAKMTPKRPRKTNRPTSLVLTSPENISLLKAKAAETKKRIGRVQKKDVKKRKQSVNIICDSSEEDETEEQRDEDETESIYNVCKMSYNDDRSSNADRGKYYSNRNLYTERVLFRTSEQWKLMIVATVENTVEAVDELTERIFTVFDTIIESEDNRFSSNEFNSSFFRKYES